MKPRPFLTWSCTCAVPINEPCPSSQHFDGIGHALFIDNNWYRTSKGHGAKAEMWREHFEVLNSQFRTAHYSSGDPTANHAKNVHLSPHCGRWSKPFMSTLEVQLSAKAGDSVGFTWLSVILRQFFRLTKQIHGHQIQESRKGTLDFFI